MSAAGANLEFNESKWWAADLATWPGPPADKIVRFVQSRVLEERDIFGVRQCCYDDVDMGKAWVLFARGQKYPNKILLLRASHDEIKSDEVEKWKSIFP